MARRRTKSKSIFDDEAILFGLKNEENPGVDLFGSDTPVPQTKVSDYYPLRGKHALSVFASAWKLSIKVQC